MTSHHFMNICHVLNARADASRSQMLPFAIFGIINYPVFYLIWYIHESLFLRLFAGFLCLILALKDYWPQKSQCFLGLYWYLTILYSLPFFGTYMFLVNHGSYTWIMNDMLGLFLLLLVVDWLSFLVLLVLGLCLGIIAYRVTCGAIEVSQVDWIGTLSSYLTAVIIGIVFSKNRENVQLRKKISLIQTLSASIAHELRTPLSSIEFNARGLKLHLSKLIEAYTIAIREKFLVPSIPPQQMEALERMPANLKVEADSALMVIDLLLANIRQTNIVINEPVVFSMAECVDTALMRYPFKGEQLQYIVWRRGEDFQLNGDRQLMVYVFFNLFRNGLYFLAKANKGPDAKITLWMDQDEEYNNFYFKDEGTGISMLDLPFIFEQFYSKNSHHGSGIGLSYCKMVVEAHGGKISCESTQGEYTLFILKFPKTVCE